MLLRRGKCIVIGFHVNHLVGMACLTEFQKLENLIYLETGAHCPTDHRDHIHNIVDRENVDSPRRGKCLPSEREHRTKKGMYVLIYLEEPERREGFEGPYYAISSLG